MFARLVQFKDRFGHCNVPFGWSEDANLGNWVILQRDLIHKRRLSAKRIQRLEVLGFKWEPGHGHEGSAR
jgi:hypothetical protein